MIAVGMRELRGSGIDSLLFLNPPHGVAHVEWQAIHVSGRHHILLLRCEPFLSRIPDPEWFQVLDLVTSHKGWALGALPHLVTTWDRQETAGGV